VGGAAEQRTGVVRMIGQTIRLFGNRSRAHELVNKAPHGAVLNIRPPTRTNEQNAKLWAMLSDLARAKPQGRDYPTDVWKALAMAMCGHTVRFEPALDGNGVVPIGFRSSRLTKDEMGELIEAIYAYGAEHNVEWSEPDKPQSAAA
jgi:hypothetical protein